MNFADALRNLSGGNHEMKELLGRTVLSVWVKDDQSEIYFQTPTGWLSWYAEGDCCSESWFADILGIGSLLGETVETIGDLAIPIDFTNLSRAEERAFNCNNDRTRQEDDCIYGIALITNKGTTTIAFRNSSNGYYGGWLCASGQSSPPPGSKQITEDWSA